tara:strand:- start:32 stop:1564 length:1533 start_codon:yes stop_codon:yes gene_type:complete
MKKSVRKNLLIAILILQNFFYLFITLINFNSLRGTDYEKYGNYLEYFIKNRADQIGLDSGVSYYWFVSLFFDLLKSPLRYSNESLEYILTASIQTANFLLFLIGLYGVFFLLKKMSIYSSEEIYLLLIILSTFPPLLGARIILKPEIMVFSLFPWLILLYYEYFENKELIFLILSIPIVATLMVLKLSISFMLVISIITIFNKQLFNLHFLSYNLISLAVFGYLIYENYQINGLHIWEHISLPNYDGTASIDYLYNINFNELWSKPYRDSFNDSMISILLADTFGDYWQRYWFHYDGWGLKINGNTVSENYPGNITIIRVSICFSIIFYLTTLFHLTREKVQFLFNIGILGYLGILALIINAFNLIGYNFFSVSKGDPMKTHLFSFLLVFTFLYFLIKIKIHQNIKIFILMLLIQNLFLLVMMNPISIGEIFNTPHLLTRIYYFGPCQLTLFIDNIFSSSFSECSGNFLLESNYHYFSHQINQIFANNFILILSFVNIIYYSFRQKYQEK